MFLDDFNPSSGQRPHPLSMKVFAALRRLALGIPIDGLVDMVAISYKVLRVFITDLEA